MLGILGDIPLTSIEHHTKRMLVSDTSLEHDLVAADVFSALEAVSTATGKLQIESIERESSMRRRTAALLRATATPPLRRTTRG